MRFEFNFVFAHNLLKEDEGECKHANNSIKLNFTSHIDNNNNYNNLNINNNSNSAVYMITLQAN